METKQQSKTLEDIIVGILQRCGLPRDVGMKIYSMRRESYDENQMTMMGLHYNMGAFHAIIARRPSGLCGARGHYTLSRNSGIDGPHVFDVYEDEVHGMIRDCNVLPIYIDSYVQLSGHCIKLWEHFDIIREHPCPFAEVLIWDRLKAHGIVVQEPIVSFPKGARDKQNCMMVWIYSDKYADSVLEVVHDHDLYNAWWLLLGMDMYRVDHRGGEQYMSRDGMLVVMEAVEILRESN